MRQSLNSGLTPAVNFLDVSKAFGSLTNEILIDKLSHHRIRGEQLSWFSSYLTSRSVTAEASDGRVSVTYGVPQG